MKRNLLLILMALLPTLASAYAAEIDGIFYNFSGNEAIVTYKSDRNSYSGDVVIPASVTYNDKTYSVTSIGYYAFGRCFSLTSVTIPNSVTSIGDGAFNYCQSLTSITIPNSVTSIGEYAFQNCNKFSSIIIPKSVTTIGVAAFEYCSGLTSIKVETGNTKYDSRENCNAIIDSESNTLITGCQNTIIPNGVDSIGNYAFSGCFGLTSIVIPASVKKIGNGVFWGCSALTSITIPNSIATIGNGAFSGCSALTSITIPNGLTSIGNDTFSGCCRLTSITIPTSVTYIGDGAFEDCSGLTSITIPERVESIGPNAFCSCSGLTSVTIPKSVTSIAFGVFQNCSAMTDVYCYADNVPKTNSKAFLNSSIATATLHVPASALDAYKTTEPWSGFGNFVTFEDEHTNIQFADATVKAICVENWDTNGDGELSKAEAAAVTSLEKKFNNTKITSFDELKYFTGLTSIGESEFTWCGTLTSITIPDRVESIGLMAFFFCQGLKSVTLGKGLATIGECVFWSCTSLTDVYCYADNVPSTDKEVFNGTPIASATLHVPSSALHAYKTTEPWSGFGTIITLDGKKQCATPTISYANGELTFNCATEGAICHSTITDADISSYSVNKVKLSVTYHISVFATKENFADSDVATATLCWIEQQPDMEGITDDEVAVREVKAVPVLIQTEGSTITVQGVKEGTDIKVYSINGTKEGAAIAGNGHAVINTNLRSGSVAIVKIGERTIKVLMK